MEEHPLIYHLLFTIHNSRTSARMKKLGIRPGKPNYLKLEEEIKLTRIIGSIISELDITCLAYNICKDHVHLIISSHENKLQHNVKILKGKSAFLYIKWKYRNSDYGKKKPALWSQKFFNAIMDNWGLFDYAKKNGMEYGNAYILNGIEYGRNNRKKHGLPQSDELEILIESFVTEYDS